MYFSFFPLKDLKRQCKTFTIIKEQHIWNINYSTYYNIKRSATFKRKYTSGSHFVVYLWTLS